MFSQLVFKLAQKIQKGELFLKRKKDVILSFVLKSSWYGLMTGCIVYLSMPKHGGPIIAPVKSEPSIKVSDKDTFAVNAERNEKPTDVEYEGLLPKGRKWLYLSEWRGEHLPTMQLREQLLRWQEKHIKEFAEWMAPIAIDVEKKTGVPAEITLFQAGMESTWGLSRLGVTANNFFGHKFRESWRGRKGVVGAVMAHDDDPNDLFVQYETPWYSVHYHGQVVSKYGVKSLKDIHKLCPCTYQTQKGCFSYATSCYDKGNRKYSVILEQAIKSDRYGVRAIIEKHRR